MGGQKILNMLCLGLLYLLGDCVGVQSSHILFVADTSVSAIVKLESDVANFSQSPFEVLPIGGLVAPVGIDYDYRNEMIYWSDEGSHTINRANLNGSFQIVIASSASTPHGLALNLEDDKIYWASRSSGSLESANLDGSSRSTLVTGISEPRAVAFSYTRRKLFFTTAGNLSSIESVDVNGQNREVLVSTDVIMPNGLAFDFTEYRLYWTDTSRDVIESITPDNPSLRSVIFSLAVDSPFDLYSLGIDIFYSDIYFSDDTTNRVYWIDIATNSINELPINFPSPAMIHVYTDVCLNLCQNGGVCVRSFASVSCTCQPGYSGEFCETDLCADRCTNGGTCLRATPGATCLCPDDYGGATCEIHARHPPWVFVCDEDRGLIYEGSLDSLLFNPIPLPNVSRPIDVGYDVDDDVIFWIDATFQTVNRAFRNGSGTSILLTGRNYRGLAVTATPPFIVVIASDGFVGWLDSSSGALSRVVYQTSNLQDIIEFQYFGQFYYIVKSPNELIVLDRNLNRVLGSGFSSSMSTMSLNRQGDKLLIADSSASVLSSCILRGISLQCDQILASDDTHQLQTVSWYRGLPVWTDTLGDGFGFLDERRGLSSAITGRNMFSSPTGFHIYLGKAYSRSPGEACLGDEYPCDSLICLPLSWRCDGVQDCPTGEDENGCDRERPDSLLLIADIDAGAIYMANFANLMFTEIPLAGVQSPVAVGYDPVEGLVYWSDVSAGVISAASIDGTNQRVILDNLRTPDGLYVDSESYTLFWTDTANDEIGAVHLNGSNRRIIVNTTLDEPRDIIVLPQRRWLYWTDWGEAAKIEMSDLLGNGRMTIIETGLVWPNGLTSDAEGTRLYWCDASLDKIESSDPFGLDRRTLIDSSHTNIHPYGVIWHRGTVMWTDWALNGFASLQLDGQEWPNEFAVIRSFIRPAGFHVFDAQSHLCNNSGIRIGEQCLCNAGFIGDASCETDYCQPNPCQNNGICVEGASENSYTCVCTDGWQGDNCTRDIEVPLIEGCPLGVENISSTAIWREPTASDNSGFISLTSTHQSGDTFPIGWSTVTYTAIDPAGNVATCTFQVVIGYCETRTNPCFAGGTCVSLSSGDRPYICSCPQGHYGDRCELDLCQPNPCQNNGYCVRGETADGYTCFCNSEWEGENCTTDIGVPVIDDCPLGVESISSTATWREPTVFDNSGFFTLTSTHQSGDTFPIGQSMVTYTVIDNAGNVATCSFPVIIGYCEFNANPCLSGNCSSVLSGDRPFICLCKQGYEGDRCEIDMQAPVIAGCPLGVESIYSTATWTEPTASDNSGFISLTSTHQSGDTFPIGRFIVMYTAIDPAGNMVTCSFPVVIGYCEYNTNPCLSGDCISMLSGDRPYSCLCQPGYYGDHCEKDWCIPNPCQNNGTCTRSRQTGNYDCVCTDEWDGKNCSFPYDPCRYPNDCPKISACVSISHYQYNCQCPSGTALRGDACSNINECADTALNSCHQNALCRDTFGSYFCVCEDGYSGNGTHCEALPSPCTSRPCLNGGTCFELTGLTYTCRCSPPYIGIDCSDVDLLPVQVRLNPLSQEVSQFERVELTCAFDNVLSFDWQKDNVTIAMTSNRQSYVIPAVTPQDIGYYRCVGRGREGQSAATAQAAVTIADLNNVAINNLVFNQQVGRPQDLSDPSSETYRNHSQFVNDFVINGLVNSDDFDNTSPSVVVSDLRPGSVVADVVIYTGSDGMSASELQRQVNSALTEIAQSSNGLLDTSRITVTSTVICYPSTWSSRYGDASFGQGELGFKTSSNETCPFYTTNANQPLATAVCTGDKISQATWIPYENCGDVRNVTEVLTEIQQDGVTGDTADEVSNHVAVVTADSSTITAKDVAVVANITADIANLNTGEPQVTREVVRIVSNIAAVDSSQLESAEEDNNAISDIVTAFEQQLRNTELADGEALNVAEENVVVQVASVRSEDLQEGAVLTVKGDSASDYSQSRIILNTTARDGKGIEVIEDFIAQVALPPEISSIAASSSSNAMQGNSSGDNIRIIMNVFSSPRLFISNSIMAFSESHAEVNRTANTPVISLSVGDAKLENLEQPINLTFTALEPDYENQTCVFWNFLINDWSSKGCEYIQTANYGTVTQGPSAELSDEIENSSGPSEPTKAELHTCSCNHLTNFAILMDTRESSGHRALRALSYIGCAVSIVCLVVALATYLCNKKLRERQSHRVFMCLCVTLIGLYVTYVIMSSLDSARSRAIPAACGVLAGLVQFFMLSSIAWMGVEGYNTYLIIVQVFNTYVPNFLKKAALAAWGIPALIVIVNGAIARSTYTRDTICFPDLWSQVGGILIPVAAILIINVIIFILVIRQLALSAKVGGKVKKDEHAERRETIERVQNAITILVLLGLTWITGYLLLIDSINDVVQTLFIVFNSFQGLFIFLLYCVRKPVVRRQWRLACAIGGDAAEDVNSSGSRKVSTASALSSSLTTGLFKTHKNKREYGGDSTLSDSGHNEGMTQSTSERDVQWYDNPIFSRKEKDKDFDNVFV